VRAGAAIGVLATAAVAATPTVAAAAPPKVSQLVAYRNGDAVQSRVTASSATAQLGSRRCAVGAGTPLAALLHSKLKVQLKDYGACSTRPADAGGLYVRRIRSDAAKGVNGWVYKVGNKVGTTGAGDPSGPFGSGRLHKGARVTWFYCHMKTTGCQRTLTVKPKALGGGQVTVTVRAYDDQGRARAAAGATVFLGTASAKADSKGVATFNADPGVAKVRAEAKGTVRSFQEQIEVR
jgi:hypothetical protein